MVTPLCGCLPSGNASSLHDLPSNHCSAYVDVENHRRVELCIRHYVSATPPIARPSVREVMAPCRTRLRPQPQHKVVEVSVTRHSVRLLGDRIHLPLLGTRFRSPHTLRCPSSPFFCVLSHELS
ncbi:hypothetical protein OH77DRAFT_1183777 [Trametes cingulata]|nr:hypothetical protein OH77DRAFT_1183777 [Trametes cingulata]